MRRLMFISILAVAVVAGLVTVGATASAESLLKPGYSGQIIHVVRWGETLNGIADRYGTSPVVIMNANGIRDARKLQVGQRLVILVRNYVSPGHTAPKPKPAPAPKPAPGGCIPYTIQPGDSVAAIAAKFGVSTTSLIQVNNLINPNYIHAGVTIRICDVVHTPPAQVAWQPAPQVIVQQVVVVPPPQPPAPVHHPVAKPVEPPVCTGNYSVRHGDTLSGIAAWYNTSVHYLRQANNLESDFLYVGQNLVVPCAAPAPKPQPPAPPAHRPPPAYHKPVLHPAVCNPSVSITQPLNNETISGVVGIIGTATISNFQFYKVEYGQGEVPFNWISIGGVKSEPATGTALTWWDTRTVPNGVYILKLTAVDNVGQFPTPCDVRVIVEN